MSKISNPLQPIPAESVLGRRSMCKSSGGIAPCFFFRGGGSRRNTERYSWTTRFGKTSPGIKHSILNKTPCLRLTKLQDEDHAAYLKGWMRRELSVSWAEDRVTEMKKEFRVSGYGRKLPDEERSQTR